ncbi:MAG: FAD-dependent oxidoreductase [Bacillota bacterium]|nr:FAD-dependent oxidoreductase [Bacillota bacterium]
MQENNKKSQLKVGEKVVVVGGGDAAVDGIEALLELGVNPMKITVIDIQKPAANPQERKKLELEGVRFRYPLFLQEVSSEGVFVHDSLGQKEFMEADTVLVFINEQPGLDFLPEELQKDRDKRGFYHREEGSFRSSDPHISVVGDVQGAGLVTHNLGRGRECALEIEAILSGREYVPEVKEPLEDDALRPQRALPVNEVDIEIEEEHDRCLHCGICVQCDECVNACPREALTRVDHEFSVDLSRCGGCGTCAASCLGGVIRMVPR